MRVLVAGDTHTSESHVKYLSEMAKVLEITTVFQLGDFGWWPRSKTRSGFPDYVNSIARENGH